MKKKKILSFGIPASALFAAAGLLFAGSAVGSTRAALNIYGDEYQTTLEVPKLDVALERQDGEEVYRAVEGNALLSEVGEDDAEAVIGKTYSEKLRVSNTGELDSYVRVRIYRSWVDDEKEPIQSLAPELIELDLAEDSGWVEGAESGGSEEMTVLYYMAPLKAGESTPDFMTGYRISNGVWKKVNENGYVYGGAALGDKTAPSGPDFKLEVEVDSVQAIGGSEAIMSAWGRSMTVADDGSLTFGGYRGSGWDVSGGDVPGDNAADGNASGNNASGNTGSSGNGQTNGN